MRWNASAASYTTKTGVRAMIAGIHTARALAAWQREPSRKKNEKVVNAGKILPMKLSDTTKEKATEESVALS